MNQFFPLTSIWILSFFTSTVLCHARNQPMLSPPLTPTPSVVITPNGHIEKESVFLVIFVSVSVTLIILWSCCVFIFWRIKGLNSSPGKVQSSDVHLPTLNTFKGALNTSKGALNTSKGRVRTPVLNRFNPLSIRGSIPEVEYKLVEAATDNFSKSSILGKGRIGCVYKASFNFGALAAVKKFDATEPCHESIFENEIELLSNIAHPNIVSLLGYCVHWETRLLIYEFMERGSLEKQLHGPSSGMALTWNIRMKIALDVARGLEYLHEHCNPRMIQRDLNSSTILLDSSYNAKISGFGLAIAGGNENKKRMQRSGSLGYEAPEYLLKGELTEKSDVYALGVVILELLLGRKPIEELAGSKCRSITTWAMPQLTDREKLPNIVDPVIRHTMDLKHLCQVAAVAVLCVQPEPSYRPLITDVVYSLIPLVPLELGGTLRTSDLNL